MPLNVTSQQAAGPSANRGLGTELNSVLGNVTKDEKGFAFMSAIVKALGGTLDDIGTNARAQERDRIMQTFEDRLRNEMQQVTQAFPPVSSSSQACVPMCTPKVTGCSCRRTTTH